MTYNNLIQLYFERCTALQGYWTIYVVVVGGLLAFSSIRKQWDPLTTALVTVLFCFFGYKNLDAIHDVIDQRAATVQLIKQFTATGPEADDLRRARGTLEPTLITTDYEGVRNFHTASDLLTVVALWAMELRRRKMAKEGRPGVS